MRKLLLITLSLLFWGVENLSAQFNRIVRLTEQARLYEKTEISIQLTSHWQNPYLQEDIALDMLITAPSGKSLLLPCYYESGASGQVSTWKARFAPQETGTYHYRFRLRKGKSEKYSKEQSMEVLPSDRPGFLHVRDYWTLQFDNGRPFRGIGEDICWESRTHDDSKFFNGLHERADLYNYEKMLPKFAGYGGNFFRTWMCPWNLPIDYKHVYNNSRYTSSDKFYNPSALVKMDRLVELSDSLHLHIMLTLGQGAYLKRDGGVATSAEDFFVNPAAKARYKNRLRYIVARWGYSPAIAMWEFFNEVDNVQYSRRDHVIPGNEIVQWHTEMSAYLKSIDPYKHIITTSISHRDIKGLNAIPDIDINQKHIYDRTSDISGEIRRYVEAFKKPYIIGEFGYEWDWNKNFNTFAGGMDTDFKRGLWYGIFSPTPVTPMSWWWEFFDNRWMNTYYRGVRAISDQMMAAGHGSFIPLKVKADSIQAFGLKCGKELFVYLYNPTLAVQIPDIIINDETNSTYNVQCYEPTLMMYRNVDDVTYSPNKIILHRFGLGSRKEMVFVLKPSSDVQEAIKAPADGTIESWITTFDRSRLFAKQEKPVFFDKENRGGARPIVVDENQTYQSIDGFGFAMTEGSAFHFQRMTAAARMKILKELFTRKADNIGVSYIRMTIGASDLNQFVYSYDDMAKGKTDFELKHFSLGHDSDDVIPVMKEVLALEPKLKILASPWSAPAWMKTNGNVRGGSLKKVCYDVYARYFVKYIQAMQEAGIPIDAVTVQNEPLNSRNTPSMQWYYQDEQSFVRDYLGPRFKAAGIKTKILIFDHNCDRPDFPLGILSDPKAAQYIDGSAFHNYAGSISTLSAVHLARPDKNIYFTEQTITERPGSPTIRIAPNVKRLIIDVMRNWSKNTILWNIASNMANEPHTDNGGCAMCQGAITIEGDSVTRNVAYYTIAHAAKFVTPGSVRIASTAPYDPSVDLTTDEERPSIKRATLIEHSDVLPNVAFKTPDGCIVLIVANTSQDVHTFRIQYKGQWATIPLSPGCVGTYRWKM
jgi:O-glycosyl hydrolase